MLVLFLAGNVLLAAGLFVHAFLFNFYLRELGLSATVMGQQVAAMTIGGLAALLPAGMVIDRLGARTALLGGVIVTTVGLVLTALLRTPVAIEAAALLVGVGGATCRVSWGPCIMRLTDETQRARAFTWNAAILIGTGAGWTLLAGAAPAWLARLGGALGLSGTQLVLLGGAAATSLALLCYLPLHLPAPRAMTRDAVRIQLPRELRLVLPLVALWMLAAALTLPFFNVFFADRFAMRVPLIGALFAGAHVETALFLVAAAEAARRWGPQRMLVWWIVLLAPSFWGLSAANILAVAVGLYVVQGLVGPATNPLIDQLVLERVRPERHGVVAAWRNAAAEAAGAVGAAAGGRIVDGASFSVLFLIAGAVAAVSGVLLVAALRSSPRAVSLAEPGPA
jgi:MFS family permease